MKYIVSQLPEENNDEFFRMNGIKLPITTEEEALAEAKRHSRRNNSDYGIFKLIKKVSPPDVKIEDVTE